MERTYQQSIDEQTDQQPAPDRGPPIGEHLPNRVFQAVSSYLTANRPKVVLFVGAILVQLRFDLYIGADGVHGGLVAGTLVAGVHGLFHLVVGAATWTGSDIVVRTARRLRARTNAVCERLDILKESLLVGPALVGASLPLIAVVFATIDFGLAIVFLTIVWIHGVRISVITIGAGGVELLIR